jgi:hypothetical protein
MNMQMQYLFNPASGALAPGRTAQRAFSRICGKRHSRAQIGEAKKKPADERA